jgi:hypothetical protein
MAESGPLPAGLTFIDHHNGTAMIRGVPDPGTGGLYVITITATNGSGPPASQSFTLTVLEVPPPLTTVTGLGP